MLAMEYEMGVLDTLEIIKEELNRCRFSNRNGRNDEIIRRLRNIIKEITELTGVKYERWDIMATTKTG